MPLALQDQHQQQQLAIGSHAEQEGIIDYFAKRGNRLREMEHEQSENFATIAQLKQASEKLRSEVASLKASPLEQVAFHKAFKLCSEK